MSPWAQRPLSRDSTGSHRMARLSCSLPPDICATAAEGPDLIFRIPTTLDEREKPKGGEGTLNSGCVSWDGGAGESAQSAK
eukprot:7747513-Pyramimonas_sp.AAC.1